MEEKNNRYYKVGVTTYVEDEKTGNEKRIKEEYIVYASGLSDVEAQVAEYMKGSQYEFTADGAQATKVLDIIGYKAKG